MALKLKKQIAGYDYEYWKILKMSTDLDNTCVRMGLYKDKETRDSNVNDFIEMKAIILDGTDYTRETAYQKIKEPVYVETGEVDEDGNIKVDEEGNPLKQQINEFTNSEDC